MTAQGNVRCGHESLCGSAPTTEISIEGLRVFSCDDESHAADLAGLLADHSDGHDRIVFRRINEGDQ